MIKALLRSMRPYQWVKNIILFAALIFDRQLLNWQGLMRTLLGVILFCLLSSAVYIMNDLLDIEADRQHPRKKHRPIASGKLTIPIAVAASAFLGVASLTAGFFLTTSFFFVLLTYVIIQLAYSSFLKNQPIIDVMVLASGFLLRVGAGVTLIQVERFSPWLYMCTGLLALYIGFGKRRAELVSLQHTAENHRKSLRGYSIDLLDKYLTIVSSATLMAYSLYTISAPSVSGNFNMLLTVPFVVYGIFRYNYLLEFKGVGGAPEEVLMTDRPLQITLLLWGISVIVLFYLL
jgi:4-hydroxybenzoate polyprenyltransferase